MTRKTEHIFHLYYPLPPSNIPTSHPTSPPYAQNSKKKKQSGYLLRRPYPANKPCRDTQPG